MFKEIIKEVETYYTDKVKKHGPTAQGADWKDLESQELRFSQLIKICDFSFPFSIIDYGCGYGYLYEYLARKKITFDYVGLDISTSMIETARKKYSQQKNSHFFFKNAFSKTADYTVASGIFNVKQNQHTKKWQEYVLYTIQELNRISLKGFSFNMLTSYSDPEKMKGNLYYADPCFYFDYCKKFFSKHVALLHDYNLYEFTLLVKK